jgi:hypothetical protein
MSKLMAFCLLVETGGAGGEILTQNLIAVGFKRRNG